MGGIISKPKVAGPSAQELKEREDARKAQEEEKALLAKQQDEEDRKKLLRCK